MSVSQTIERVWPCIMLRQTHDVDLTTGTIITLCAPRVKPPGDRAAPDGAPPCVALRRIKGSSAANLGHGPLKTSTVNDLRLSHAVISINPANGQPAAMPAAQPWLQPGLQSAPEPPRLQTHQPSHRFPALNQYPRNRAAQPQKPTNLEPSSNFTK